MVARRPQGSRNRTSALSSRKKCAAFIQSAEAAPTRLIVAVLHPARYRSVWFRRGWRNDDARANAYLGGRPPRCTMRDDRCRPRPPRSTIVVSLYLKPKERASVSSEPLVRRADLAVNRLAEHGDDIAALTAYRAESLCAASSARGHVDVGAQVLRPHLRALLSPSCTQRVIEVFGLGVAGETMMPEQMHILEGGHRDAPCGMTAVGPVPRDQRSSAAGLALLETHPAGRVDQARRSRVRDGTGVRHSASP